MTSSTHTEFFNIVDAFTDDYRQLNAVVTRAALNSNYQWNSKHRLNFFCNKTVSTNHVFYMSN